MRHVRIYRAVDAIARARSIRQAAATLAISPSALNRQILALEEELGVALFERLSQGVRLSTAGEIYLRSFRTHLAELERSKAQIADLSGLRAGVVRVGVSPDLASSFAGRVAAGYRARFPQIEIVLTRIACDAVADALRSYDLDLVAAINPVLDFDVETTQAEPVDIACIGNFPEDAPATMRLSELIERPLVVPTDDAGLRRAVDAAFAARGLSGRYCLVTDRVDPGALKNGGDAVHIAASLDVDRDAVAAAGLRVRSLHPGEARGVTACVLQLRSRVLPVASAKFAGDMARALIASRQPPDGTGHGRS